MGSKVGSKMGSEYRRLFFKIGLLFCKTHASAHCLGIFRFRPISEDINKVVGWLCFSGITGFSMEVTEPDIDISHKLL